MNDFTSHVNDSRRLGSARDMRGISNVGELLGSRPTPVSLGIGRTRMDRTHRT